MSLSQVRSILAPVDFSPASRRAAEAADQLAVAAQARLTLLYVRPQIETIMMDTAAPESPERVARRMGDLDERLRIWARGLRCADLETELINGDVLRAILEASARYDLLVISGRGREQLTDFLLGTTAERVVRGARCSVLVVRAPDGA